MASKYSSALTTASVDSRELRKAFNKLPKEVKDDIRAANLIESQKLEKAIIAEIGLGDPPQAQLVKSAIKAKRDRDIRVDAGGAKKAGRAYASSKGNGRKYRAPAGALIHGAEYGSSGKQTDRKDRRMGARFVRPHKADGYFIGPGTRAFAPQLLANWERLIRNAIAKEGL